MKVFEKNYIPTNNRSRDDYDKEARVQTWIGDGQDADAEVFTASGTQLDIVAVIMMDTGLGQHGVVLDLAFPVERDGDGQTEKSFDNSSKIKAR